MPTSTTTATLPGTLRASEVPADYDRATCPWLPSLWLAPSPSLARLRQRSHAAWQGWQRRREITASAWRTAHDGRRGALQVRAEERYARALDLELAAEARYGRARRALWIAECRAAGVGPVQAEAAARREAAEAYQRDLDALRAAEIAQD